ncbi:efflux RND transporter periplasmic adaptor subunit [Mucilaginibacter rubeus]|uniref:Efflux RND transporter periplasmic adaptor subunit n=2 Tax=Mucilaginibacter rubeus TaxID=2027860 RepID=A0A364WTC4_9SPHI|nr:MULTISPECIES: efflux RND transporter periplasmic adaptor subunit [Mucilaginibacter]QEM06116.1 efflux RND transporter periplasmic adaptor subunit [Mucilaginibacter rubeus]QEM13633.1 efflux RND transporter periplasmic adaptor subunit [Mucilaginibacter rubeus]QEM18696.1 efflux RND transporter periplasmic adaptor subunit [Mucilaginibacter gossypii]QTE36309.1 efflux RND transporter periplasmic adaptor subunit [Mucilaginibacter gossypii]QTE44762.1 efflux RND transporter periplasmic adaptor subuni
MKPATKTYLYKTTALIAALALFSCGGKTVDKTATKTMEKPKTENMTTVTLTDAQIKTAGIDTGHAGNRPVATSLKVTGAIDVPPQNMVSISFPMGGYLKSSKLLPGMHVSRGETIAMMEDQQFIQLQQDFLTAKAKLNFAQKDFERQRDLNVSKANSDKIFQQAQADYESQKIMVSSLAEKLRLIGMNPAKVTDGTITRSAAIHSPIDGFVSKVNVNIGKYVNPSDVLFEIVDPRDIHLALDVFEKDVTLLHQGQTVMAYTNSNPEKKYRCKIVLIGKDLTDQRKTVVHCHFKQYDKDLLPGTFMNAEIEINANRPLTLPEDAIVNYENKSYAFKVKGKNAYEIVEIKPGIAKDGYVELLANSSELRNQTFVIKGAYSLLMKMKNTGEDE